MEFPNPFGVPLRLPEVVEKTVEQYDKREMFLLSKMFPELKNKAAVKVASLFNVNGKQISVSSIQALHEIFPDHDAGELSGVIHDEKSLIEAAQEFAQDTKQMRRRVWLALNGLPLSQDARKGIENAFRSQTKPDSEPPSAEKGEEEIVWVPMPAHLPYGNLPELDTLLDASRKLKSAELPNAEVYVVSADGTVAQTVKLSSQETLAAFQYVQKWLNYIKENRDLLEKKFRQEKGLPADTKIDPQEVKLSCLRRFTQKRVSQILEPKIGALEPEMSLEVRFTQYRREMPSVIRKRVASKNSLREFYTERMEYAPLGQAQVVEDEARRTELEIPEMRNLSDLASFVGGETFMLSEMRERGSGSRIKFQATEAREKEKLNELQKAYVEISRATKSGEWARAVEVYLKYLEYWPQFLQHRMGVIDLHKKYERGDIPRLPKKILSLASGPHEELRAQWDVAKIFPGTQIPQVVQLDFSQEMLERSAETLPKGAAKYAKDVIGDMRDVEVEGEDYDVVECSSFDNLTEEDDIKRMLVNSAGKLAVGGVFRFMVGIPFSDGFCRALEENGFKVLDKNMQVGISPKEAERIKKEKGEDVLSRIQYKLKRHLYFTARKDTPTDLEKLKRDFEVVPVYGSKPKRYTSGAVLKEVRKTAHGDQDREIDLATHLLVAMNAKFFLQKRGLKPDELAFSLEALRGNVDTVSALKLAQFFLQDRDLSEYAHLAFEAIKDVPEIVNNLSVNLLGHSNQALVAAVESVLIERPNSYLAPLLKSPVEREKKVQVLRRMLENEAAISKLESYLWVDADQDVLDLVFPVLPPGVKLRLPLRWRFDERLADYYKKYSLDSGKTQGFTAQELEQVASLDELPLQEQNKAFDDLVAWAVNKKDFRSLLDLANRAAEFSEADSGWLQTHRKTVESIFEVIKSGLDVKKMDLETLREVLEAKTKALGPDQANTLRQTLEERVAELDSRHFGSFIQYLESRKRRFEVEGEVWDKERMIGLVRNNIKKIIRSYNLEALFRKEPEVMDAVADVLTDHWKEIMVRERLGHIPYDVLLKLLEDDTVYKDRVFSELCKRDPAKLQEALGKMEREDVLEFINTNPRDVLIFVPQLIDEYPECVENVGFVRNAIHIAPEKIQPHYEDLDLGSKVLLAARFPERMDDETFFKSFEASMSGFGHSDKILAYGAAVDRNPERALKIAKDINAEILHSIPGRIDKILDAIPDFFIKFPGAQTEDVLARALNLRFEIFLENIKRVPILTLRNVLSREKPNLTGGQLKRIIEARPDIWKAYMVKDFAKEYPELDDVARSLDSEERLVRGMEDEMINAEDAAKIDEILMRRPSLLGKDVVKRLVRLDSSLGVKWINKLDSWEVRKLIIELWDDVPRVRTLIDGRPDLVDRFFLDELKNKDPFSAHGLIQKREGWYARESEGELKGSVKRWLAEHSDTEILKLLESLAEDHPYCEDAFDGLAGKNIKLAMGFAETRPEFKKRLIQKFSVEAIKTNPDYFMDERGLDVEVVKAVASKDFGLATTFFDRLDEKGVISVLAKAVEKQDENTVKAIWRDFPQVRSNDMVLKKYLERFPHLLLAWRDDIQKEKRDAMREGLRLSMADRLHRIFDINELAQFDASGLNEFQSAKFEPTSNRFYVGFFAVLSNGMKIFVPKNLEHGILGRRDPERDEVTVSLVPNGHGNGVVGELSILQLNPVQRLESMENLPEEKRTKMLETAKNYLLTRLTHRGDPRDTEILDKYGLNSFAMKGIRPQTRGTDGRMVGYMVMLENDREIFVPMSNVLAQDLDLRNLQDYKVRLQPNRNGDNTVGMLSRRNPFKE